MIKNNQKLLNTFHVIIDALVIIFSYVAAWYIRFRSGIFEMAPWYLSIQEYMRVLVFLVPEYLILYYIFQLYTPKRVQGRRLEAWRIIQANVIGLMTFILLLYLARESDFSRTMMFVFFCVNVFVEVVGRNILREELRNIRKKGYNQKHILLVGYSRAAEQYIDRIRANPEWGYIVRGILADNKPRGTEYRGVKVLGRTENLSIVLPENKLDEIVITLGLAEYHKLEHIVGMCEKSGVHTKFIPDYNLFGAVTAIILFSPVMAVTAAVIKLTSPGPLIFKQERIGFQNKPFLMYKFRSMVVQDEKKERGGWTTPDDPRVTRFGKFIRKTSIDELPQLFNVLKGNMSLVGPRPERPQFVEKFSEEIPRYRVKHQVRPGLTGWAQVNGYRGDTSIRRRIEYDLYYIENWTLGFDFKIIFLTFFKGFVNKNAY